MSVPNNGNPPVAIPIVGKIQPSLSSVPITLDDQTRTLRMTFRAMKLIQDKTGIIMWKPGAFNMDELEPETLATIIWAGLLHESPDLELEEVMDMPYFTLGNFHYILDRLLALWGDSVPVATAEDNNTDADPKDLAAVAEDRMN